MEPWVHDLDSHLMTKVLASKNLHKRINTMETKGLSIAKSNLWNPLNDKEVYKKYLPQNVKNFKARYGIDVTENTLDMLFPYAGYSPVKSTIDIDKLPIYQNLELNQKIQAYIYSGKHGSKFHSDDLLLNMIYDEFISEIDTQYQDIVEQGEENYEMEIDYCQAAAKFIEIIMRFKWTNAWEVLGSVIHFWLRNESIVKKHYPEEEEWQEMLPMNLFSENVLKVLMSMPDFLHVPYNAFFKARLNDQAKRWLDTAWQYRETVADPSGNYSLLVLAPATDDVSNMENIENINPAPRPVITSKIIQNTRESISIDNRPTRTPLDETSDFPFQSEDMATSLTPNRDDESTIQESHGVFADNESYDTVLETTGRSLSSAIPLGDRLNIVDCSTAGYQADNESNNNSTFFN